MGRLSSYTQQLHSISVNHSPNPNPTNLNPNLKSAECTRLLFFRNAGCKNATHETV